MDSDFKIIIKNSLYEILRIDNFSHNFPTHVHKRTCVGKIISGEKILIINGQKLLLKKGDFFYIPANVPHCCQMEKDKNVSYIVLCVNDTEMINEKMIHDDLLSISIDPKEICLLYRYALSIDNRPVSISNNNVNQLLKYIEENYDKELSTDFLAEKTNLNSYYLHHIFKENVGLSLHQFIIQTRIKKVKEKILTGSDPLGTALDCGFYDQSHYIKNFKKHSGITPQKFIDSIKVL